MASCAPEVEHLCDAVAARQESGRLLHRPFLALLLVDVGEHSELAHVSLHQLYPRVRHEALHGVEAP